MSQFDCSFDKSRLDIGAIHAFLSNAYWSPGIPLQTVERPIENSLCIGGYINGLQVAFARMVTDKATFAYLADVFVIPSHPGPGAVSSPCGDAPVSSRASGSEAHASRHT
jgi:hypothetical protein